MRFDPNDLVFASPFLLLSGLACALLLLDAFARSASRAFLCPLAVASCVLTLGALAHLWPEVGEQGKSIFAGMVLVDRFSLFVTATAVVGAALSMMLAPGFMREHRFDYGELYPLVLFATAGVSLMVSASDMVTLFLGLETMSLSVYVLTGSWRTNARSAEGAMKYFLMGAFASAILLYGMALVYGSTGTTSLAAVDRAAAAMKEGDAVLVIGMVMIVIAFVFKVGAVPFHMWAPDAYQGAPTPITAFMAAAVKAAAFAAALRVLMTSFPAPGLRATGNGWVYLLSGVSALTMIFANLVAMRQDNVKRMLAYSSVAHAGYLLLGVVAVGVVGAEARTALLYYLLAYTFTTVGAFGVVAWIGSRGNERLLIDDWSGLASRHPGMALAMTVFLLSLGGFPPTAGFFGKFYLFKAAMQRSELYPLVFVGVASSLVSVYYYLRVVMAMYFRPAHRPAEPIQSNALTWALALSALGVLALGLLPGPALQLASASLLGK